MTKYVLSLDGGGVRGLATSVFLYELEKKIGKPLSSKFDLVVGTSTGGILALIISVLEIEGPRLLEIYSEENLKKIFTRSFSSLFRTKYNGHKKMEVMYDASCHLTTLTDAIRVGRVCDDYGLLWYEDPYADGGLSFSGHKLLKEKVQTPIMIGEHVRTLETHTDLMISGATDFGRVDPDYDGGITGCHKLVSASEKEIK
mgnify:CR=1 FL=1